jgi:hypothetical protein
VVLKTGIGILDQFTGLWCRGNTATAGSFPELKYDVTAHWLVWDEITSDPGGNGGISEAD